MSNDDRKGTSTFNPFVFWSQRQDRILLKIALRNLEDKVISVEEGQKLKLTTRAEGQNGVHDYELELKLFSTINQQNWHHIERSNYLDVALFKEKSEWWPKLLLNGPTPPWLKVDFDRWVDEEPEEEEEEDNTTIDPREADREMFRKWALDTRNKEATAKVQETSYDNNFMSFGRDLSPEDELKMMVVFFYNLLQLILTGFLLGAISWGGAFNNDPVYFGRVFSKFYIPLSISTGFTFVEVLMGAVKLTPGGFINPLLQSCGRSIALAVVTYGDSGAQQSLSVFHMMFTWLMADVIRFSYLMFTALGRKYYYLTWLRYTMWLPLYPLGFGMEIVNILNCMPYYTRKAIEDNVPYHIILYIYIPIAIVGFLKLYFHMFKLRRNKLGPGFNWRPSKDIPSKKSN